MGVLYFIVAVGFGIWSAIGQEWYWYALAPVIMIVAGGSICTSYIQGLTRLYAVIVVPGAKRIRGAIGILAINLTSFLIGCVIAHFILEEWLIFAFFIVACVILSTIVAVHDTQFKLAIKRERRLQEALGRGQKDEQKQ
ncbi:MAG: hypothetical protein ABII09_11015 [Planctomycetota bacterium]